MSTSTLDAPTGAPLFQDLASLPELLAPACQRVTAFPIDEADQATIQQYLQRLRSELRACLGFPSLVENEAICRPVRRIQTSS